MITEIIEVLHLSILNKHNNLMFSNQKLWYIKIDNNIRIIDLLANKDITDIDYLKIIPTHKTTYKIIFKDELFD